MNIILSLLMSFGLMKQINPPVNAHCIPKNPNRNVCLFIHVVELSQINPGAPNSNIIAVSNISIQLSDRIGIFKTNKFGYNTFEVRKNHNVTITYTVSNVYKQPGRVPVPINEIASRVITVLERR